MIVRLSGQGQFRLDDDCLGRLNELDNAAVEAVESGKEDSFRDLLGQMHELVRSDGSALTDDELMGSQIIIPPADTTLDEARADFAGEGLIPD